MINVNICLFLFHLEIRLYLNQAWDQTGVSHCQHEGIKNSSDFSNGIIHLLTFWQLKVSITIRSSRSVATKGIMFYNCSPIWEPTKPLFYRTTKVEQLFSFSEITYTFASIYYFVCFNLLFNFIIYYFISERQRRTNTYFELRMV